MALAKFSTQRATLGQDPEIGTFPNGDMYQKFGVATNKNWKDKDGEWQTKAVWLNVQITRDYLVQKAMEMGLEKGDSIAMEGYIDANTVEKDGKEKTYTNFIITSFEKLARKED